MSRSMPSALPAVDPRLALARRRRRRARDRRGAAMVEFAIMLPIYVMIVLGTIEACSMAYLKQSLKLAAYEGVRTTMVPTTTTANVIASCNRILTPRGVQGATFTVNPVSFNSSPFGSMTMVRVSAPCDQNTVIRPWFFSGRTVEAEAYMMQERNAP